MSDLARLSSCPACIQSAWISSDFPPVTTAISLCLLQASTLPGKRWRLSSLIGLMRLGSSETSSEASHTRFASWWQATLQDRSDCSVFSLLIKHPNSFNGFYVEIHAVGGHLKNGSSPWPLRHERPSSWVRPRRTHELATRQVGHLFQATVLKLNNVQLWFVLVNQVGTNWEGAARWVQSRVAMTKSCGLK